MLRCFKSSFFDSFIKMIHCVQAARRTQLSQTDQQQWALLRRVGGLMTGPKGHVFDVKMCLCPFIKHTAGWQQYKPKLNLLYKTGSLHFKMALDKSMCRETNNHHNKFLGQAFREEKGTDYLLKHFALENSFLEHTISAVTVKHAAQSVVFGFTALDETKQK